jgi:hypothetical protein
MHGETVRKIFVVDKSLSPKVWDVILMFKNGARICPLYCPPEEEEDNDDNNNSYYYYYCYYPHSSSSSSSSSSSASSLTRNLLFEICPLVDVLLISNELKYRETNL